VVQGRPEASRRGGPYSPARPTGPRS